MSLKPLLLSLVSWVLISIGGLSDLAAQDCGDPGTITTEYYTKDQDGNQEFVSEDFLYLCRDTLYAEVDISALNIEVDGEDAPSGIFYFSMREAPGRSSLTKEAFFDQILYQKSGEPLVLKPADIHLAREKEIPDFDFKDGLFLIPVFVDHLTDENPESWFLEDCVHVFSNAGITVYDFQIRAERRWEIKFGLWEFTGFSSKFSLRDMVEVVVKNKTTGEEVDFTWYDDHTIWIPPRARGDLYDIDLYFHKSNGERCRKGNYSDMEFPFFDVKVSIEKRIGYRDQSVCLPVRANFFLSINDFSFDYYWHEDLVGFDRLSSIHPFLENAIVARVVDEGDRRQSLKISRNPDWVDTVTILDKNEILFEMCFTPLVDGPQDILIRPGTWAEPGDDTHYFEQVGVQVEGRSETGVISVQDGEYFEIRLEQFCSADPDLFNYQLTAMGETGPYTYSFDDEVLPDSAFADSVILVRDIPAGIYYFSVTDRLGSKRSDSLKLYPGAGIPNRFQAEVVPERIRFPSCGGGTDGEVEISVVPPGESYRYYWIEGNRTFEEPYIIDLSEGYHQIEVTDEKNCRDTVSFHMPDGNKMSVEWIPDDVLLCADERYAKVGIQVSTSEYTILVDGSREFHNPDSLTLPVGDHSLHLTDQEGCSKDTVIRIHRMEQYDPGPGFPDRIEMNEGEDLGIVVTPVEGGEIRWLADNNEVGFGENLHWLPETSGFVILEVTYPPRCIFSDSFYVEVMREEELSHIDEINLPNAFSPNAGGSNDVLSVPISKTGPIRQVLQLDIYDRYGSCIFSSGPFSGSHYESGWDGRIGSQWAPSDVYVARAVVVLANGHEKLLVWSVHLLL